MTKQKDIDLTPELKRPLDKSQMGRDVAALNNLVGVLNDPRVTGAEVPPGEDVKARPVEIADGPQTQVAPAPLPAPQIAPAVPRELSRVIYTGKLSVGKDHIAAASGATIFGLADPLYFLLNYLYGVKESEVTSTQNKGLAGVRATLQALGQWGRNEVNEQYPITPARLTFCTMIRAMGNRLTEASPEMCVRWSQFGLNQDIWLEAVNLRVEKWRSANPGKRAAITNVRFPNEYKFFTAKGWTHYHVMCSAATWQRRLAKQKLTPESNAVKDMSEALANHLDKDVMQRISKQPQGAQLRVIWNDSDARPLSNRLITTAQFLQEVAIEQSIPADMPSVQTGE